VLVKMLLFERCGHPDAYAQLAKAVNEDAEGKPRFLAEWEEKAHAGEELKLQAPWDDTFILEWLTVPPRLSDMDLRGVLYVSREHAPLAIKGCGISCVIAESFARIFYRNSINIGLPIFECPEAARSIEEGDEVEVDASTGLIRNLTRNQTYEAKPMPEFIQELIEAGGLMKWVVKKK